MRSSCGNETCHTDHLSPHKPPSLRQRPLSLVHMALKPGVATIGNSCPSQCLWAQCPCLTAPIPAAKYRGQNCQNPVSQPEVLSPAPKYEGAAPFLLVVGCWFLLVARVPSQGLQALLLLGLCLDHFPHIRSPWSSFQSHLLCARAICTHHFRPSGVHLLVFLASHIWPFLAHFSPSSHHTLFLYPCIFFSHAVFPCCAFLLTHYLSRK